MGCLPVDPSSTEVCTVGGMVANIPSGIHSYLYGRRPKTTCLGYRKVFWAAVLFFNLTEQNTIKIYRKAERLYTKKLKKLKVNSRLALKNASGYNIHTEIKKDKEKLTQLFGRK